MLRLKRYVTSDGDTTSGFYWPRDPRVAIVPKPPETCGDCIFFDGEAQCLLPLARGVQYHKTKQKSVLSKDGVTDWFDHMTPKPNKTTEQRSCREIS